MTPPLSSCKLIKACGSNDIYLLHANEKSYIAKIYSKRACWNFTKEHYLFELSFQHFLEKKGIQTAAPLKNNQTSIVSEFQSPEYKKFFSLHPFIKKDAKHQTTSKKYSNLGVSLAMLHKEGKKFTPPTERVLSIDFLIDAPLERIHSLENSLSLELHKKFDLLAQGIKKDLTEISFSSFDEGIIHGDMHCGNFLLSEKNIAILDFELCGYGKYIYDLSTLYWDIVLFKEEKDFSSIWNPFVKGYECTAHIKREEFQSIPTIAKARHFFMIGSSYILYPELAKFHTEKRLAQDLNKIERFESTTSRIEAI